MLGSFLTKGLQLFIRSTLLIQEWMADGAAAMRTLRCTRKVSGRKAAAISTRPMAATAMRAMVLSMAASLHPEFAEALDLGVGRDAFEVLHLVELTHFDLGALVRAHRVGEPARPLQCFLAGTHLDQRVAGDQF